MNIFIFLNFNTQRAGAFYILCAQYTAIADRMRIEHDIDIWALHLVRYRVCVNFTKYSMGRSVANDVYILAFGIMRDMRHYSAGSTLQTVNPIYRDTVCHIYGEFITPQYEYHSVIITIRFVCIFLFQRVNTFHRQGDTEMAGP